MSFFRAYDPSTLRRIDTFSLLRLLLLLCVLLTTVFLRQEVLGTAVILRLYGALTVTFLISLINVSYWQDTLRVRYFVQSQLLYDLLLVSYFVYLTGIDESIFLFLYLLNIVFTALLYQLHGSLAVAFLSGSIYAAIFYINTDTSNTTHLYTLAYNELLFLLIALLSGQFMDELKKQQILLSEQQANIIRLETINHKLLNNIPVGILLVGINDVLENINKTALQLLGLTKAPEGIITVQDLVPSLAGLKERWITFSEKRRLRYNFRHTLPNGLKKNFSLQIVHLPEESNKTNITETTSTKSVFVFQDVSKILELEEKLEMESKLATVGQLAAGIAHEIRNPLASISGSIETLNEHLHINNDEDKKLINISLREIKRLNKLITEFLEFAKPKEEHYKDFLLAKLIQEVVDAIHTRSADLAQTEFSVFINENITLHADPERIKQVFFNIFLNSIEASLQKPTQISIHAKNDEHDVKIIISDNGPGILPDAAKKIFDPFFTTKASGTGLGLSTVAQILKSHKGSIRALPLDRGACFEIILPMATNMEARGTA